MKPICDEDLDTFSRSMKGATGNPSSFSISLCERKEKKTIQSHFDIVSELWGTMKLVVGVDINLSTLQVFIIYAGKTNSESNDRIKIYISRQQGQPMDTRWNMESQD